MVNLTDGLFLILKYTRLKDMDLGNNSHTKFHLIFQRMESTFLFLNSVKLPTALLVPRYLIFRLARLKLSKTSTLLLRLVQEQFLMIYLLKLMSLIVECMHQIVK